MATPSSQQQLGNATKVHVTSSPSGSEIYIDGKFFGNAPSDIALAPGEHVVRVTLGGKELTRTVQITGGEIQLRTAARGLRSHTPTGDSHTDRRTMV